jgi:hypothetical protein
MLPGNRRALVALNNGETMTVPVGCMQEIPPALDPDEPKSEPQASGDCEKSRADVHMAVDSDSSVPTPSRDEPLHAADLERGELEQERPDSQMTGSARSSPEPQSSINASEWSSQESQDPRHSSVDPADFSSDSEFD